MSPNETASQCDLCQHRIRPDTCSAFPGGIPDVVLEGIHDHRMPFDGDRGVRFEPRVAAGAATECCGGSGGPGAPNVGGGPENAAETTTGRQAAHVER